MPNSVFYIPNGPKNLQQLFPADFFNIEEFYVQVKDNAGTVIATTNLSQVDICDEDYVRIHFVNKLGAIDAINFKIVDIQHEPKSESTEKPLKSPLVKSEHGINRFNVRSNDTYTVINDDYNEEDMDYIDELLDSPMAWMQWKGVQSQVDDYIPIIINDQKSQKRKDEDRYTYEVQIEFKLSHEKMSLRN